MPIMERLATVHSVTSYGFDMDGHGHSEPHKEADRCFIPSWDVVVEDAKAHLKFLENIGSFKGAKVKPIAIGMSMGGLLVAHLGATMPDYFSGTCIVAAPIDIEWTVSLRILDAVGTCLANLFPRQRWVSAVRVQDMSDEQDVLDNYLADPLVFRGNTRNRTAISIATGFRRLKEMDTSKIPHPMLAIHGTKDRCTSIRAAEALTKRWGVSPRTNFVAVEGGYHMLIAGRRRTDIIDNIIAPFLLDCGTKFDVTNRESVYAIDKE